MEESKVILNDEYRDLLTYFRLFMMRERGVLEKTGEEELKAIVARNARASEIESARELYNRGEVDADFYKSVYYAHRQDFAEAIKSGEAQRVDTPEEGPKLSPEFSELARYFRLSIARNRGEITPDERQELDEIIANNERAATLEDARKRLLAGELKPNNYEELVAVHRGALAQAIKDMYNAKEETKKEPVKEEKPELREPTKEDLEVKNPVKKPVPTLRVPNDEDIKIKIKKDEPVPTLRVPTEEDLRPKKSEPELRTPTEEDLRPKKSEPELRTPTGEDLRPKKSEPELRAPNEEDLKVKKNNNEELVNGIPKYGVNLTQEFRQLARYFTLSLIREKGDLQPEGAKELEALVNINERARALETTRNQYLAGNISEKSYREFHALQRSALAEAIRRATPTKDMNRYKEKTNENFNDPGPGSGPSGGSAEIDNMEDLQKVALARRAIRAYNEYQTITNSLGYSDINDLLEHFNFNTGKFKEKETSNERVATHERTR